MTFRTHYDNLKVSRTATKEEIKKSYRRLCSQHHPDKHPKENQEKQNKILTIINKSYAVLSDTKLRKEHDEWIAHQELCAKNSNGNYQKQNTNQYNEYMRRQEEEKRRREQARKRWEEEQENIRRKKEAEKKQAEILRQEKEAALKKAKKAKLNKFIFLAIISIVGVIGYLATSNKNTTSDISSKQSIPAPIRIEKISRDVRDDKLITDIYLSNHRNDVTTTQLAELLKGSLKNKKSCSLKEEYQHRVVYKYVFHFLKGGKRIYMDVRLDHLCDS